MKIYARKLTKADLMADGITEITKEGRIFKGDKEIFARWIPNKTTGDYLGIQISERDPEGHLIKGKNRVYKYTNKNGTVKEYISWGAKTRTIGLHRAIWAWHYGEVLDGYVVDHISNKHSTLDDYHLDNLQLLTPKQNLAKDREESTREIYCKLDRPRSYYENKLASYEKLYEEAKALRDAEKAHHLRTNIAQTRARLRYYDNHIKEVSEMTEYQKDLAELRSWKKNFKERGNKTMWKECIKVEKVAKEKRDNAAFIVKHALEVIHKTFGGGAR